MRGVRVGVDLVDVEAFRRRFEGREEILGTVFTDAELSYCESRRDRWPHLAARYAAKEAALKALRTGLAGTMTWRDVEVTRDATGAPALACRGDVAGRIAREGLASPALSLSHTDHQAIAVVILGAP